MNYKNPDSLVDTAWLEDHLNAPDVRIVDATMFLPNVDRNAAKEFAECHIPGAVYFDINDIADSDTDLPHMLPEVEKFSSKVRKLGLGDGCRIVVYDSNGGYLAACRVWWMFRVFGHKDIAVLDGGLPKWLAENRPVTDEVTVLKERHFSARKNTTLVRSVKQIKNLLNAPKEQIVDARALDRFLGTAPEPREGMKSGHIPGSISLPFTQFMDMQNHAVFKSADEIKSAIDQAGIDVKKPIVTSCGSGVTACVLAMGMFLLGHENVAIYDGSWSEWGMRDDTPVET